jgi:hypothetical protein
MPYVCKRFDVTRANDQAIVTWAHGPRQDLLPELTGDGGGGGATAAAPGRVNDADDDDDDDDWVRSAARTVTNQYLGWLVGWLVDGLVGWLAAGPGVRAARRPGGGRRAAGRASHGRCVHFPAGRSLSL